MARATWFCIDIESSGPVPHLYDMISLGAVAVYTADDGALKGGDPFYVEIRPTAPRWDHSTDSIHHLDRESLLRDGISLGTALKQLQEFVALNLVSGTTPVFVGHNAPFDWSFISYGYQLCGLINPFGYKALDTKALATGVLGLHWLDSNKETLEKLLGLPAQEAKQIHRADYDAWYQSLILIKLLERSSCADL